MPRCNESSAEFLPTRILGKTVHGRLNPRRDSDTARHFDVAVDRAHRYGSSHCPAARDGNNTKNEDECEPGSLAHRATTHFVKM